MRASLLSGLVFSAVLGLSASAEATPKKHNSCGNNGRGRAVVVVTTNQATSVQSTPCPQHNQGYTQRPSQGYSQPPSRGYSRGGSYSYGRRHYGYRRGYVVYGSSYYSPAPSYYYNPAPAPAPAPVRPRYERVAEIGLRATAGGTEGAAETLAGVGAYARVRRANLGLEASVDSAAILDNNGKQVAARVPVLGAAMLYLNPNSPVRVYGLLGGGASFQQVPGVTSQALTVQAGAGLDIDLSPRASLNVDVRGLQDLNAQVVEGDALRASEGPTAFVVGNAGISFKF